jgi:hypothetical protein
MSYLLFDHCVSLMPSIVSDIIFSEPSGRRHALVMFSAAVIFSSVYLSAAFEGRGADVRWVFFLIAGMTFSGLAESLPEDNRRAAGLLRLLAVAAPASLIALLVVAPEVVNPP